MSLNDLLSPGEQCELSSHMSTCSCWEVQSPLFIFLTPNKVVYMFNKFRVMEFM